MKIRALLTLVLGVVLALVLAACGGPTAPPADDRPVTTDGTPYSLAGSPDVLELAIGFVDASVPLVTTDAVAPAAVSELFEAIYVGPFAVEVDGVIEVAFPEADEMPAAALVPLAESFPLNLSSAACAPTVAPLAARATQTFFFGFGFPSMLGLTAEGPFLTVASDVQIANGTVLTDFPGSVYTSLFVDRDAKLVSGAACVDYDVDLDLAAGWNQVAWTFGGAVNVTARVIAPTDFVVAAASPLEPPPEEPVLVPLGPNVGWLQVR